MQVARFNVGFSLTSTNINAHASVSFNTFPNPFEMGVITASNENPSFY